ncbi:hypothetical protein FHL15_004858 [Xylaria flabelliformis]|uniref:RING-type domain-containing protein n=1 Tax=Xylaria flabelliformis TaxID=2512241 RepID=A0A553I2H2_9PEZI|nr:hypothetical protein FHL15_004858 [Xylaria flabelliformis]
MPPTPPTGNCILVGRDALTGIDPVWITARGNRPRAGAVYSGQLGPNPFVQSHSNSGTPIQFYIPNVAFFRNQVVSNIKQLLRESTGDKDLQFGERDRRLWEDPFQTGYTNERLITWAKPGQGLQKASIFACPIPVLRLQRNDLAYDKVPAFHLTHLSPKIHKMVETCLHAIRDHYPHITYRQFHYYMFLWAHYQLEKHVHHGITFNPRVGSPLKQFVTQMPTVLDFTEKTGSPFYPNLALATKRWSIYKSTWDGPIYMNTWDGLVGSDDPFILLSHELLDLFRGGEGFPISGYLLPGDLKGSQNEPFYNSGHPNGFGGKTHAPTVVETVEAIGDVRRVLDPNAPLVDRDISSSEHRACMPVQLINTWRRRAPAPTQSSTTAESNTSSEQDQPVMAVELFNLLPRHRTGGKGLSTIRDGHPCSICKLPMPLGTAQVVLECGHWADVVCMKGWLTEKSSSCPECGSVTVHGPPSEPAASSSESGDRRPFEPLIAAA